MRTLFAWWGMAVLLVVSACGGGNTAVSLSAGNGVGVGNVAAGAGRIVALPADTANDVLNRLNDRGLAAGFRLGADRAIDLPLTVSDTNAALASDTRFFGSDQADWRLLRTASVNRDGVMAGHGIVGGNHLAWLWNGTPATRRAVPDGVSIAAVVGPSDTGSIAASVFDPATEEQQILLWQASGSRSSIYRSVGAKAGMSLFGMASNGWIGGVERDGILLTPKIYNGSWRALPIDVIECQCDAVALNTRGQVLMTPRGGLGGDPRGYLVSTRGITLLPRPDPGARYAGLNDLGDVAGTADSGPFVILDGVLHDLNTYAGSARFGWRLRTAVAINNQRQVLGIGDWQGQARWYRLDLR